MQCSCQENKNYKTHESVSLCIGTANTDHSHVILLLIIVSVVVGAALTVVNAPQSTAKSWQFLEPHAEKSCGFPCSWGSELKGLRAFSLRNFELSVPTFKGSLRGSVRAPLRAP